MELQGYVDHFFQKCKTEKKGKNEFEVHLLRENYNLWEHLFQCFKHLLRIKISRQDRGDLKGHENRKN